MSGPGPRRLLPWSLAAALLVGCASLPGGREDEDIGVIRDKSPGDIYAQMGSEYLRAGQPAVALRKLKRGLETDPSNPQVHAVLGRLYEQLGETALADQHYSRASSLEPQNPYYHNAWGSFLCQQQQYDKADRQFRLALENPLYDRPWAASTNAGVCAHRAGRLDEAETYLRAALAANPRIPLALRKMAEISLEKGDFAAAKAYLERYAQLAPHDAETLLIGVRAERELGNAEGASRYRDELERLFPDAPATRTARESTPP
jgi:type IV pilus assembly protein PilF